MAQATFHSLRGEKSALIMLKENAFVYNATPVYVPKAAVEGKQPGDIIEVPDGYKLVDMIDIETGDVRVAKDNTPLKVLAY